MEYINESFSSVASFIKTVADRKHVPGMRESSTRNDESFCGTKSYEYATQLALYGDEDSKQKIRNSALKVSTKNAKTQQRTQARVVRTIIGIRPCVPAAICGLPNSMYRRLAERVKKPVVTLFYSMAASAGVPSYKIVNAGATLAEAIQIAERSGVRVNLYAGIAAVGYSMQLASMFVKVKDSSKDFDLLRMAYVLINPSFLRRHYFKWIETKNELTPSYWGGYGTPIESQAKLDDLKKRIQPNPDFLLTYDLIKNLTAEDIVKMITQ